MPFPPLFSGLLVALLTTFGLPGATCDDAPSTTSTTTATRAPAAARAAGQADSTTDARAPSAGRSAGAGVLALNYGDLDATNASRADYIVMQPWEGARIRAFKRDHPGVRVLMYKDVSAVRKDAHESGTFSTGLSYAQAEARGYLLRDADGRVIEWSDWPGLYPAAVGARGYQNQWTANVLRDLRSAGWDGVMLDDTLTSLSHSTFGDRVSPRIPNDAAMYRATTSFLSRVGPALERAGFLAMPNVTVHWDDWRATLEDWTRYVSGWENEYFVKWGLDRSERFHDADWQWKSDMAAWCARRNVPLLAITYSDSRDAAAQIYHRATWLLTWNGRTGASFFVPAEAGASHWSPRANTRLGRPSRAETVDHGSGVHRRRYSGGLVLVNPTTTGRRANVGRGLTDLSGHRVSSVWLPPTSAALLRRAG